MDIFLIFLNMKVYCVFSLESPHRGNSNEYTSQYTLSPSHPQWGNSNEYTQYTSYSIKKKITQNYPKICSNGIFSKGLKNKLETVLVNELSVSEPLKFYCIYAWTC